MVEQPVPLRAVRRKCRPVVDRLPELLYVGDVRAYGGRRAGSGLEVMRRGEMVGVGVGVENPVHRQPFALDIAENRVGTGRGGRTGFLVEVMNGIDNRAASGR